MQGLKLSRATAPKRLHIHAAHSAGEHRVQGNETEVNREQPFRATEYGKECRDQTTEDQAQNGRRLTQAAFFAEAQQAVGADELPMGGVVQDREVHRPRSLLSDAYGEEVALRRGGQ